MRNQKGQKTNRITAAKTGEKVGWREVTVLDSIPRSNMFGAALFSLCKLHSTATHT